MSRLKEFIEHVARWLSQPLEHDHSQLPDLYPCLLKSAIADPQAQVLEEQSLTILRAS